MPESVASAPPSRPKAAATVILGTIAFFLIVGIVSKGLARLLRGSAFQSLRARTTLAISGSALGEILILILLVVYLRRRQRSLRDLGLGRRSPLRGWAVAAVVTALYVWLTFAGVLQGHHALAEISWFHIYNALVAGIIAGSIEEIFFRGFVMTELQWGGFGTAVQLIASGLLFGIAHSGWGFFAGHANQAALVGAVVATSVLGLLYAATYIVSRRSLMPSVAGHVIMDLLIEPWLILSALAAAAPPPH